MNKYKISSTLVKNENDEIITLNKLDKDNNYPGYRLQGLIIKNKKVKIQIPIYFPWHDMVECLEEGLYFNVYQLGGYYTLNRIVCKNKTLIMHNESFICGGDCRTKLKISLEELSDVIDEIRDKFI